MPTLYPGVFIARSGDAVGRIDGLQRGPDGLRFTLTLWPGTRQRPEIVLQPWDEDTQAVRGVLRATADGQDYVMPSALVHRGHGEHDEPEEWVGPDDGDRARPHLWLQGYSSLDMDGSYTFTPVLRTSPEAVQHLDVNLVVQELELELVWSIDLAAPLYEAPAENTDAGAGAASRSRFARPVLFQNIETSEADLAVGRLDSFHLTRQILTFRQTIWAHPDTLGRLSLGGAELWFEREASPVGIFSATIAGKTYVGNNGRSVSSRLTMSDARTVRDHVRVDWALGLTGLAKASYRSEPIIFELVDPGSEVELRWDTQLTSANQP